LNYFLERGGIGDLLMRIPYYNALAFCGVPFKLLIPSDKTEFFSLFFKDNDILPVSQSLLAKSSLYAWWFAHMHHIDKKNDMVFVPSSYHDRKLLACAAMLRIPRAAYEGEACSREADMSGFTVIRNPYRKAGKGVDAHISRHSDAFFRAFFEQLPFYEDIYKNYPRIKNYAYAPSGYDMVIMTDAGAEYRRYPQDLWQRFLDMLPRELRIVQIGLNQMELSHPGISGLKTRNLRRIFELIADTPLFVGNDTGFTHWSYFSGNKTVCILGAGDLNRFLPWDSDLFSLKCIHSRNCICSMWNCSRADLKESVPPCIANIDPHIIYEEYMLMTNIPEPACC